MTSNQIRHAWCIRRIDRALRIKKDRLQEAVLRGNSIRSEARALKTIRSKLDAVAFFVTGFALVISNAGLQYCESATSGL